MSTGSSHSPFTKVYDYIVVGGGTAGPVVARRLAESCPDATLLLLEAGPTHESIISNSSMGWKNIYETIHDWGYNTVPQKHANNRVVNIPRGKFLGGCSGINAMLILRGTKADYDKWADSGCKGWGWNDVLPYFKKSETFHPTDEFPATEYHGSSGPLHTSVFPLTPISAGLVNSYRDKGFDYKPDMFVEGEGEGVGHAVRTVYKGIRTTGADFVSIDAPSNLTVLASSPVLRILLSDSEAGSSPRASAVEVEDQSSERTDPAQPKRHVIRARKEIILSAGTYNSPALLMHSGIGPRQHLNDVGIKCAVDLKGVGSNLQDHMIVPSLFDLNKPHLTYDSFVYPPGAAEWMVNHNGAMSRFPFGPMAYKRMNDLMKDVPEWKDAQAMTGLEDPTGQRPTQPHIEYFDKEVYGDSPLIIGHPSPPTHSAFAMVTMLCGPQSRGTVRIQPSNTPGAAPDPFAHPVIDHAYLSSPLDIAVLAEGCRLAHEVVLEGNGTKEHIAGAWPKGSVHPKDTQEWKEYVKARVGTCYHPAGTCKMGPDSDDWAVVDERLRVKGVLGLRVADCSIMPWLNNGHTQAPAYMIGEKCAALVLEDSL